MICSEQTNDRNGATKSIVNTSTSTSMILIWGRDNTSNLQWVSNQIFSGNNGDDINITKSGEDSVEYSAAANG